MSPSHQERVLLARKYFQRKGYRVHSGLQFGCELVLYADDPDRVHSDFCVHVVEDSRVNWMTIQTLARSMAILHKQLIIFDIKPTSSENKNTFAVDNEESGSDIEPIFYYEVSELAIASGHAPFRHKRQTAVKVGGQLKKQKF